MGTDKLRIQNQHQTGARQASEAQAPHTSAEGLTTEPGPDQTLANAAVMGSVEVTLAHRA